MNILYSVTPYLLVAVLLAGVMFPDAQIGIKRPFLKQGESKNLTKLFVVLGLILVAVTVFIFISRNINPLAR